MFDCKFPHKPLDDLEKRKRLRQKKARDEKRREKRIEIEENKKQGKCKYSLVHNGSSKLLLMIMHTVPYLHDNIFDLMFPQILRCISG